MLSQWSCQVTVYMLSRSVVNYVIVSLELRLCGGYGDGDGDDDDDD